MDIFRSYTVFNIFDAELIGFIIAIALASKVLTRALGKVIGQVRHLFLIKCVAFFIFIYLGQSFLFEFIGIAIMFRIAYLIEFRILASPNHPFLELLIMVAYLFFIKFEWVNSWQTTSIAYLQIAVIC